MTTHDFINIVNQLSLVERLNIIEAMLKKIREDNSSMDTSNEHINGRTQSTILDFAGIISEEEAVIFEAAINETRRIDVNEW